MRFGQTSFVRNVVVLSGGGAVAQLIPVILTPVLTRLYAPAEMGILALYLAFIGFFANGTTLGYSLAIVSATTDEEATDLVIVSAAAVIPVAIIGTILFWVLTVRGWLGFESLSNNAWIPMGGSLILTGGFFILRYWLVRTENYQRISKATVAQSIGRVGTQVLVGVAGLGWGGLLWSEVLGRALGLCIMLRQKQSDIFESVLPPKYRRLRTVALKYRKFPLYTTPSSLINNLTLVLPVPLISNYFGIQAAGQFSIASRVLLLPMAMIGASVGDVFHKRIAAYSQEKPERAFPFLLMVSGSLFLIGLIPLVVVTLFGETLWTTILGDEWRTAGKIAAAIAPWAAMQFAVGPVSQIVSVYQGQELKLIYDVLGLTSIIVVFSLSSQLNWSLIETCSFLGLSQASVYGVYFLLLTRIVKKRQMVNYLLEKGPNVNLTEEHP